MYTELVKIIEGGLIGDKEKVYNYALVLANSLENTGDNSLSKKIKSLLSNKKVNMVSLDNFSSKPVDGESRMEMVDVSIPNIDINTLVINKYIEQEISEFIKCYMNRDKIIKAGIDAENSLLMYGPPGCGKTTIAQYIAVETGLPLVTVRLDGMISSLLGSTAKNIRKIFEYASKRDCILFLDEFDVIAKVRDDKNETGELKRVVNSLIQNIDMLSSNSIIIAATNHHELLDPAIWRRFSRVLTLTKPDCDEIYELIKIFLAHRENCICENDKKLIQLSKAMCGMSHSDIKTLISNCIKNSIINDQEINMMNLYREIYLFNNHSILNEDDFIKFLIKNEVTHKEIQNVGFQLRKIQSISKEMRKE